MIPHIEMNQELEVSKETVNKKNHAPIVRPVGRVSGTRKSKINRTHGGCGDGREPILEYAYPHSETEVLFGRN